MTISPILSVSLCLIATCATNAQESAKNARVIANSTSQSPVSPVVQVLSYGSQISLNGITLQGNWWQQTETSGRSVTYLGDGVLRQFMGVDFLDSSNPARQPVQWFSSITTPIALNTKLLRGYRYLDITNFAQRAGWRIQANSNTLVITTPTAKVTDIVQGQQPSGDRIVINLDRPAPWQVRQESVVRKPPETPSSQVTTPPNKEWKITLDGIADPALLQRYTPPSSTPPNLLKQSLPQLSTAPTPEKLIKQVEVVNNQTIIRLSTAWSQSLQISSVANPSRLIIDIRPDAIVARDIAWTAGLSWRQRLINLDTASFPVVWLEINPRDFGLKLKPIWASSSPLAGTAPLIETAQRQLALAAINGGFFNRNNKFPLGAIRRDGEWISGPILNRGAIAWNDAGEFYFGRLTLAETLTSNNDQRLPILVLNSGYVQSGISRYTSVWGPTYTPLTDNEILLIVQKDKIINQLSGGRAGEKAVSIPADGYLLTLRGNAATTVSKLSVGTVVKITSATIPADFSRYPHILGAGPLLMQNRQIVLNAKSEKFSDAFIAEKAIRSGICTNIKGDLMIVTVHNRVGGNGPSLAEHAKLMQAMGCVNALNLDGGSSTSLYLGGQLLDRSPSTAARVHNGIGIFGKPE